MSAGRVALLVPPTPMEAPPDEQDTLQQAAEIRECLRLLGRQAVTVVFGGDRMAVGAELEAVAPDVVVNLVEDLPEGPDQAYLATELLDRLKLAYTGARTPALRALGDKRQMKAWLRRTGLPTPADGAGADGRLIVKSAIAHASIGLDARSIVASLAAAQAAIVERAEFFGGPWFAEAYVPGREFNVGMLETSSGAMLLPVAEIVFPPEGEGLQIVDYAAKWEPGSASYAATPRRFGTNPADRPLLAELDRLAQACWRAFGLNGAARIDFRVEAGGHPFIVDVNANPCLARDAGLCAAAAQVGLSQTDIVAQLLESALA